MIPLILLACQAGDNLPPRFETVNGEEIRYLFGFPISRVFEDFVAEAGDIVELDIGVKDPNYDDISLLFPSAPPGLDFDSHERSGTIEITADYPLPFVELYVMALDERGASSLLVLGFPTFQAKEEDGFKFFHVFMEGSGDVSDGFSGTVSIASGEIPCRWEWASVSGDEMENCPFCTHTWVLDLGEGAEVLGDCSLFEEELSGLGELKIGWAESADIEDIQYQNPVFVWDEELDWIPAGQGQIIDNQFDFTFDVNW